MRLAGLAIRPFGLRRTVRSRMTLTYDTVFPDVRGGAAGHR